MDIDADEVPVLDGSAASFVYLLQSAGIVLQEGPGPRRATVPIEMREAEDVGVRPGSRITASR